MIYCILVLPFLLILYLFAVMPRIPKRDISHLLGVDYAHRGLWDNVLPENSLPAFCKAADYGVGIELDVRLTRDGVPVVFHDDSLLRMCGYDIKLSHIDYHELVRYPLSGTPWTIPSFAEVLDHINGRVPLIIELKADSDSPIEPLCALTNQLLRKYRGSYCIESFHPGIVRWFRLAAPDTIRGQLAYGLYETIPAERTFKKRLLSACVMNCIGRPDFIAYAPTTDRNAAMWFLRKLHPWLVAWTVRSQHEMDVVRNRYDLLIFEGFIPNGYQDIADMQNNTGITEC